MNYLKKKTKYLMLGIQPLTNKNFNPFPINWAAQTKYLSFFKTISNKYGFIRGESGPDLIFLRPRLPGPPHIRNNIRNIQNAPPISRQFILNIFFDQFYNAGAGSDTAGIDVIKAPPLFLEPRSRGLPSHIKSSHFQPIDRLQKHFHNALRFSIIPRGMSHALPPLQKKSRHGAQHTAITPAPAVRFPVFHNHQSYPRNAIEQLSIVSPHIFPRFLSHYFFPLSKKWRHRSLDTPMTRENYGTKYGPGTTELANLYPVSPDQLLYLRNTGPTHLKHFPSRPLWFNPHIYHEEHKVHKENPGLSRLKRIPNPRALALLQNAVNQLSTSPRHFFQRVSSHYLRPLQERKRHKALDPVMAPKRAVDYPVFHSHQSYLRNAIEQLSIVSPHIFPRFLSHYFFPLSKKWRHRPLDTSMTRENYGTKYESGTTELANLYPVSPDQLLYLRPLQKRLINRSFDIVGTMAVHGTKDEAGTTEAANLRSISLDQQSYLQNAIQTLSILPRHLLQRASQSLGKRRRPGEQDPAMTPQPAVDYSIFLNHQSYSRNAIEQLSIVSPHIFPRFLSHYFFPLSKKWRHRPLDTSMTRENYGTKYESGTTELANLYPVSLNQLLYLRTLQKRRINRSFDILGTMAVHGTKDEAGTMEAANLRSISLDQQSYLQNAIQTFSISPRQAVRPMIRNKSGPGNTACMPVAKFISRLVSDKISRFSLKRYLSAAQKNPMASYPQMMLPGKTNSLLPYHSKTAQRQAGRKKTEQKIRISHDAAAPLEDIVYKQNTNIDQLVKQSVKTEQIKNKPHNNNMMQSKYPGQAYPPAQSDAAMRGLSHRETKKLAGQVYQLIAKQVAFEKRRRGLS